MKNVKKLIKYFIIFYLIWSLISFFSDPIRKNQYEIFNYSDSSIQIDGFTKDETNINETLEKNGQRSLLLGGYSEEKKQYFRIMREKNIVYDSSNYRGSVTSSGVQLASGVIIKDEGFEITHNKIYFPVYFDQITHLFRYKIEIR